MGKQALPTEEGWVFASAHTNKPYHPTDIQKRHIRPAAFALWHVRTAELGRRLVLARIDRHQTASGCSSTMSVRRMPGSTVGSAGIRSAIVPFVADETGAPMKVQQELMRHASIQTTMNVYGQLCRPRSGKRTARS